MALLVASPVDPVALASSVYNAFTAYLIMT